MGKRALDGLEGITKVERGFRGFTEINTVTYDPSRITVKEMENVLKNIGTYRQTLPID